MKPKVLIILILLGLSIIAAGKCFPQCSIYCYCFPENGRGVCVDDK